ncbi:DUF4105 domain-containing protein [Candidatus Kaiserbacteria bacterium]|nr:DUF4105 domain-containing protein [Candidatus Kaiserbacteria bacterium]
MITFDTLRQRPLLKWPAIILLVWLSIYLILVIAFRPSHDRDWELGHESLPQITYSATSSNFSIKNFRNFDWTGAKEAEIVYQDRSFDMADMTGIDVFISHFDDFEGLAHIFLSFNFAESDNVVVSLETRREVGESFSPLLGILRQYEIIYVIGSERDIVGLRTGFRNERVYLYPTKATPEQAQELFRRIFVEVNDVYDKPRMYNTLTHNCTNELTRPVEAMSSVNFPLTWKSVLPGYFDEILYDLELISTDGSFIDVKNRHFIDNESVDVKSATYEQDLRQQD